MTPVLRDERLLDLLVKRATEELSAQEQAEVDSLRAAHRGADLEFAEKVAAALALAGVQEEPMPAGLRTRLQCSADDWVSSGGLAGAARKAGTPPGEAPVASTAVADELAQRRAREKQPTAPNRLPWFAAAACLLLAIAAWWPRLREGMSLQDVQVQEPTPAVQREKLLASASSIVRADWTAPGGIDPANPVQGDIVWDPATQQGYMRFTGLKANDPRQFQYQLWIFDAEQDERYPIDGGVFDIPPGQQEVVVPVDAKIGVEAPLMFAVTAEKPGGVVVSSREQIVALAKVAPG